MPFGGGTVVSALVPMTLPAGLRRWQRNLAVAMGNALRQGEDPVIRAALAGRQAHADAVVRDAVAWALSA